MFTKILAVVVLLLSCSTLANKIHVKVGAGIRPPFLLADGSGMGPEILNAFNLVQTEFHFELIPVPIGRRTMSLQEGWVDIIMWDNLNWGWDLSSGLLASKPLLHSKDFFVTSLANDKKEQDYFDSFHNKVICAVNGYHYKFLDYQTDYKLLKDKFNIILVRTEEESIKMALYKRCDISVVSQSALNWFYKSNPAQRKALLASNKLDTQYSRNFLVPPYSPISIEELNTIYDKAQKLKLLSPIYQTYGQELQHK
ncbi:MAG: transporter substrate-binding domain-containing protein [Gammaproteobacteria bacterium]|nr:transporter substrate-binding domain-containing protein [Gammaproteobacteria bacterium]